MSYSKSRRGFSAFVGMGNSGDDATRMGAHRRIDNNSVLEFFASTAAIMNERGCLSQKDTDNLRIVINSIQSNIESREKPVVLQLLKHNDEFCSILTTRYGSQGLYQNLLRHTIRSGFIDTRSHLSAFGHELIDKSQLFLNRSIGLYENGRLEKRVLYSSLLVDTAEILEHSSNCIDQVVQELSLMVPHAMEGGGLEDHDLDDEIAQALGFSGIYYGSLPALAERRMRQLASYAFDNIASCLSELTSRLRKDPDHEAEIGLAITAENLRIEGQRLANFPTTESKNIGNWEIKRQFLLSQISRINSLLRELSHGTIEILQTSGLSEKHVGTHVSEGVKRKIQFDLITKGAGTKVAASATNALTTYLADHDILPKNIIVSELSKIHPNLSVNSLNILQTLCGQSNLQNTKVAEKGKTLKKAETLRKVFSKHVSPTSKTIVTLFICMFFGSCGLKTMPVSDLKDYRPDIPFHNGGFKWFDSMSTLETSTLETSTLETSTLETSTLETSTLELKSKARPLPPTKDLKKLQGEPQKTGEDLEPR